MEVGDDDDVSQVCHVSHSFILAGPRKKDVCVIKEAGGGKVDLLHAGWSAPDHISRTLSDWRTDIADEYQTINSAITQPRVYVAGPEMKSAHRTVSLTLARVHVDRSLLRRPPSICSVACPKLVESGGPFLLLPRSRSSS